MCTRAYDAWLSLFDSDLSAIYDRELPAFGKLTMLYYVFDAEVNRIKSMMNIRMAALKSDMKKQDFIKKCKKFTGLAKSQFVYAPPSSHASSEEFSNGPPVPRLQLISSSEVFPVGIRSRQSISSRGDFFEGSPVLGQQRSPPPLKKSHSVTNMMISNDGKNDDSNIMESTFADHSPNKRGPRRPKRSNILPKQAPSKYKRKRTPEDNATLTQLFLAQEEAEYKKKMDTNQASMSVTKMIDYINSSDDESDVTVDLELDDVPISERKKKRVITSNQPVLGAGPPLRDYNDDDDPVKEVVRGKERKKLEGWSCQECKDYYGALNLSPEALKKKQNECSKHRSKFKPREETLEGFWDLSFAPSPKMQDSQESLVLNYKKN